MKADDIYGIPVGKQGEWWPVASLAFRPNDRCLIQ